MFLLSCNNKKKENIKTVVQENSTEKELSIDGLIYSLAFDGTKSETEYDDVMATYAPNRLGIEKKAMSMNGLSEYAKIDNHESINPKDGITLSIWYKPSSFKGSGNDPIVLKPSSPDGSPFVQYLFGLTGNEYPSPKVQGSFKFALSINGEYVLLKTKSNLWSPNNWYNLTGTYNGERMQFFVNGKLENAKTIKDGRLDIYDTDAFIGRSLDNKINTPGVYDNFRIYNRALTNEEISLLNE